jgi:hypothetical protein
MNNFAVGDRVSFKATTHMTYEGEGEVINIFPYAIKYPYEVLFDSQIDVHSVLCFSAKELQHIKDDTELGDFL